MKNKIFAAAIATTFLAAAAGAQTFSAHQYRSHVAFLADDLLEGREVGSRGHEIAARYVASRFEELGLVPAANKSWYQEMPLVQTALTGTPTIAIGGRRFAHGKEILVRPGAEAGVFNLDESAVFVGYGLKAPESGLDDYAGLDVRGKVVVVLSGAPQGLPSDVAAHLNREKQRVAEQHGAVGMLLVRTRSEAERRPWERMIGGANSPSVTWVQSNGQPYVEAGGVRFAALVDTPVAEALFAGAPKSFSAILDEAAQGGRIAGFALARPVKVTRESIVTNLKSRNVVGWLPGSDPSLANEYVALTAHLDGVGMDKDGNARAGAIDNAAGVAAMLEAARALATSGTRPRRSILFVALTGEEKGLLGAQYLAENPIVSGKMIGLVNLDTPILLYDFVDVIAFGSEHSTLGPIVERAAARMQVALAPDPLPQENLFTRSDHYQFVRKGVPSVFLLTGFGNGGKEQFLGYMNGPYHSAGDDLGQAFNWEAGARFSRLNYLIAKEIADLAEAPRWYEGSFFGDTFGGGQQKAPKPKM